MTKIGIDFGTSNTGVAISTKNSKANLLQSDKYGLKSLESCLLLGRDKKNELFFATGSEARDLYYAQPKGTRFLQGIKRLLPKNEGVITLLRENFKVELLASEILKKVTQILVHEGIDISSSKIIAGRPVILSDDPYSDKIAMNRLENAFEIAGFKNVTFVYEPIAAAWYYRDEIAQGSTVLFFDCGGGTTDFSLVRYGDIKEQEFKIIDQGGVAIAGRNLDEDIFHSYIAPELGRGAVYDIQSKIAMPTQYYFRLVSIQQFYGLSTPNVQRELRNFLSRIPVNDKGKIENLLFAIENDQPPKLLSSAENIKMSLKSVDDVNVANLDYLLHPSIVKINGGDCIVATEMSINRISQALDNFIERNLEELKCLDYIVLTGGMSKSFLIQDMVKLKFKNVDFLYKETSAICKGLAEWV